MGTRIVHFGVSPSSDILAALTANGYEFDVCGTSVERLKERTHQHDDFDAVAVSGHDAPKVLDVLIPLRSSVKVPLILFHDDRSSEHSQFDLVIPDGAPFPDLLNSVEALIERSRALRADTAIQIGRYRSSLRQALSLRTQSVAAQLESRRIRAKRGDVEVERVSIRSVLVVDDYARWRETMCSMLKDRANCAELCEAQDGVEAVEMATALKPQLILLDLDLPRQNGIEAAKQIARSSPNSVILFVSMNNCAEIVVAALSTGAKGFLLKTDAPTELFPAIKAVLENKQYLSPNLRRAYSDDIN